MAESLARSKLETADGLEAPLPATVCWFPEGISARERRGRTPQRHILAMGFTKTVAKEAPESYKPYYLRLGCLSIEHGVSV